MPSKMNGYLHQGLSLGNYRTLRQREYPKSFHKEKHGSVKIMENKNGIIFSVVTLESRNP